MRNIDKLSSSFVCSLFVSYVGDEVPPTPLAIAALDDDGFSFVLTDRCIFVNAYSNKQDDAIMKAIHDDDDQPPDELPEVPLYLTVIDQCKRNDWFFALFADSDRLVKQTNNQITAIVIR